MFLQKNVSEAYIIEMLEFLIDSIFAMFDGHVSQQSLAYLCDPLLIVLLLYSHEENFIQKFLKKSKMKLTQTFNLTFRYIDDVLSK